jgi:hypothetical protein
MKNPMELVLEVNGRPSRYLLQIYEGLNFEDLQAGHCRIQAIFIDQSAMFGFLKQLFNMGYEIISMNCITLEGQPGEGSGEGSCF